MNTRTAAASKPAAKHPKASPAPVASAAEAKSRAKAHLSGGTAKSFSEPAERPAVEPIAETAIQLVPLHQLRRAPENVRHIAPGEDVDKLADDIAAHGLLQSLIGYQERGLHGDPGSLLFTFIVGGGRRLQALELLELRGAITDEYRVPVLIRDKGEAVELSLSENLQKREMNPVDEFEAFAQLMKPGHLAPADLAKRFGFTERYVRQRLRLANLQPEILEALRDREITIVSAMAYASTQDPALQSEVFKKQKKSTYGDKHSSAGIRRDLSSKAVLTSDPLYRFVGADAYEAAGGSYEDDLFREAGNERTLMHPFLLPDLVRTGIERERGKRFPEIVAETPTIMGWVMPDDFRIRSWGVNTRPTPPEGFVLIDTWDHEPIHKRIRNNKIFFHSTVGIDDQGEFTIWPRMVYVEADQERAARGTLDRDDGARAERPAPIDWAAHRREEDLQQTQWQLAARELLESGAFLDVTVPREYVEPVEDAKRPDQAGGGRLVTMQIFVTTEQFEAQRTAAEAKTATAEDKVAEIRAMDPEPAAIVADYVLFFRWESGSYQDAQEGGDREPDRSLGAQSLEDLLTDASEIGEVWATIDEYQAVRGPARRAAA